VNKSGETTWKSFSDIGEGWFPLVDTFEKLVDWDERFNNMPPVQITSVKEKLGQLRIYYNGGDVKTDAYASFVRSYSERVCEECGEPTSLRVEGHLIRTVCDECL